MMTPTTPIYCAVLCSLLLLFVGPTGSMRAADIQWNGSGGPWGNPTSWQNVDNWDSFSNGGYLVHRVPGDGDTATLATPVNGDVRLLANMAPINGLWIRRGMNLFTNGYLLEIDNAGLGSVGISEGATLNVNPNANKLGLRESCCCTSAGRSDRRSQFANTMAVKVSQLR